MSSFTIAFESGDDMRSTTKSAIETGVVEPGLYAISVRLLVVV